MFLRYLQYVLTDFRQTFVTGAPWDTDDLITFLGQKVKRHTIAAEAHHSTRRYRRVQLFLVYARWLPVVQPEALCFLAVRESPSKAFSVRLPWPELVGNFVQ